MSVMVHPAAKMVETAEERDLFDYLEELVADMDLSDLGSPYDLAQRMVAALPDVGAVWGNAIGAVYTSKGLQDWLGISRQALSQQAQNHTLLRLKTADGHFVYPSFQFDHTGGRLPHLAAVLNALAQGIDDPWTWATWLNTQDEAGFTPAKRMRDGQWKAVVVEARSDASAWAAS